jgi:hypothetical protein
LSSPPLPASISWVLRLKAETSSNRVAWDWSNALSLLDRLAWDQSKR